MVEVYYYIPAEEVENAVECGLKLSECFEKEVIIGNTKMKCISALLNPKDDIEKYRSESLKCVKLELPSEYCFVADRYLYEIGLNHQAVMGLYLDSIMPIKDYPFGLYRLPECLVTSTVISEHISLLDKRLDSPVLFDNSEELYINNIVENLKEDYPNINDIMLYYFYCELEKEGKLEKVEDKGSKAVVFLDKEAGKAFMAKKPDI
ncbi:hypothetical protein [Acetivibrio mesophilus]|uniref:Uncharacterized protein n=1 Tax=Acetivibrio mesophilus TaxID=2487273 RepID=A0A4Q0I138_9FIRM|nr:hypothetical protein [Acetivibrio mesophilus]ODM27388.1 hypothetical protein A7W90_14830 [Clostridium sp. Bc-iso-3]RXE57954.1 hypothetical protein EFD62_14735 [Acetivibrio mesophilus]HHV28992.1 hypothetical protein [Clostridium sp.]